MNYSKKGIKERQKSLHASSHKWSKKLLLAVMNLMVLGILAIGVIGASAGIGVFKGIIDTAPSIENIDVTPTAFSTFVYDLEGNQQLLLGSDQHEDPAYFGSLTGIAETANGYIAADGNMREFYFWSKDGTLLAEVDCYDMFGTRYPWIEDMKVAEDGSVMVLMTQDRDDDSASELMVFRLTGF